MDYQDFLCKLLAGNPAYMILTAENRGAMRGLPARVPERFLDVGIAEQTMIGMAAGLALRGRIPLVHAMAAFLTMRAFEFIRTDLGLGSLPVKLIGSAAGFLSTANGPTHQALEDISLIRGIPGFTIFCPADEAELLLGLPVLLPRPEPLYVRFTQTQAQVTHTAFTFGKAEIIRHPGEVTILVYGFLLGEAILAADLLAAEGISTGIINLRMLQPWDEQAVEQVIKTSRLIVTLEDHFLSGGLYSILAEFMVRHQLKCKVLPLALDNKWFSPALLPAILEYEGFSGQQIATKIIDNYKK